MGLNPNFEQREQRRKMTLKDIVERLKDPRLARPLLFAAGLLAVFLIAYFGSQPPAPTPAAPPPAAPTPTPAEVRPNRVSLLDAPLRVSVPASCTVEIVGVRDGGGGITYALDSANLGRTYLNKAPVGGRNTYRLAPAGS